MSDVNVSNDKKVTILALLSAIRGDDNDNCGASPCNIISYHIMSEGCHIFSSLVIHSSGKEEVSVVMASLHLICCEFSH